jgi:gliding motility-associated-like protein
VNLISQGPTTIKVFPNTGTWYYVSALKPNGCKITDSIYVDVHIPVSINLGIDSSLCEGDTLQLNAGPGFNSYSWSTGEHTAAIDVYQAGNYHVMAIDHNNCTSKDSFSVLQVYPLPVTQLPSQSAICKDQPLILHAGPGFTSYLWSTGALTENIAVSSLGIYWVRVKNSSGCSQTDSIDINQVYTSPSNFIKEGIETICNFETINITPVKNYVSYLWSTGSVNNSISINNAGNYWLQVTDTNGCKGRDSFRLITKDCNIDVYFPNSFTPNNDRLNDTYKPKAYGRLRSYHIMIFNRYGERLFESWNILEGWNGMYKGAKQEIGAYVWKCSYQLGDEKMKNKSGSLMLIR